MDTSTPVRKLKSVNDADVKPNVSNSCGQNGSEIILSNSSSFQNRAPFEEESDLLLSQNDYEFMGKFQQVLPFSPIPCGKNVPSTLLPLLDTPDFRWSTSMLSSHHFETQPSDSLDASLEENFISSPGEQLVIGEESAGYTTTSNCDIVIHQKPTYGSNIIKNTSTIVPSPILTQSKHKKLSGTVNKNLFPTPSSSDHPEEPNSNVIIDSFSISDVTLNALYSKNSTYVETNVLDEQDINFSLDNTFDLIDRKVETEILEKRYKKPFYYPVEIVSKCTVQVDDIYESVLPFESNAKLPVSSTASRSLPKGMMSFSQLSQLSNEDAVKQEFTFPVSLFDDVTNNAEISLSPNTHEKRVSWWMTFPVRFCRIISNDRDLYARLKAYFEYYRVDFAKMVFETNRRSVREDFENAISLSQQFQLPYLRNSTINTCLNIRLQTSQLTFAFIGEFFDFFRLYFYLVYNFDVASSRLAIFVAAVNRLNHKKRKRAILLADKTECIEKSSQVVVKSSHDSPERKVIRTSHSEYTNNARTEFIDENTVELLFEDFDITYSKAEESTLPVQSNNFGTVSEGNISNKEKSVVTISNKLPLETFSSIEQPKVVITSSPNIKNGLGGFISARGKRLRVNEKSIQRTKKLFNDSTDLEPMSDDFISSEKLFSTVQSNKSELYCKAFEQTKSSVEALVETKSVVNEQKIGGLSVAAGKSCEKDEESMTQAKKFLEVYTDELVGLNSSQSKKDLFDFQNIGRGVPQLGFSTAAGKSIQIEKESLTKAKQMMADVTNEYDTNLERSTNITTASNGFSNCNIERLNDLSKTEMFPTSTSTSFPGFSTAGGKLIKIDEKLLMKAQEINDMANEEYADFVCTKHAPTAITEISVDVEQSVTSSGSGMSRSDSTSAHIPAFDGFSTSDGKSIQIQEKSMAKAEIMMERVANDKNIDLVRTKSIHTSSSGTSTNGVLRSNGMSTCSHEANLNLTSMQPISTGILGNEQTAFSTAANKSIKINKKSLLKAKQMIEDVSLETYPLDDTEINGNMRTSNDSALHSEGDCFNSDSNFSAVAGFASVEYPAFSTARGKSIEIGEKSLSRAKKLFEELSTEENSILEKRFTTSVNVDSDLKHMKSIPNVGFCTAGGKSIVIDNELLSQARKKLEELPNNWLPNELSRLNSPPSTYDEEIVRQSHQIKRSDMQLSSGFSTAAGKSIKVDKKLVAEGRKKLENVTDDWQPSLHSRALQSLEQEITDQNKKACGFSTAGGKKLFVDFETLKKAETLLESVILGESAEEKAKSNAIFTPVDRPASPILPEVANIDDKRCGAEFEMIDSSSTLDIAREVSENASAIFSDVSDAFGTHVPTSSCVSEAQIQRSKASSPILDSNKGGRKRRNTQKRRNQLSLTPLDVTYVRREGDGGEKPSPESVLRMFNDSFAQKCAKRKEASSNLSYPASKKVKQTDRTEIAQKRQKAAVEQQNYVEKKDKESCRQRIGSYMTEKMKGGRKSLTEMVDGRPQKYSREKLLQLGVKRSVINVNAKIAQEFVFTPDFLHQDHLNAVGMNYGDECVVIPNENNEVGLEQLQRAFLASPGVDPRLISISWIRNHYRWIIWKLTSVEKSFPTIFGGSYLTIDRVLMQLKFRYDWEIDWCKRSALKKILECDDSASKAMILCVSDIASIEKNTNEHQMELTDGWYSVVCNCDAEMSKLIIKKKVTVGTKLLVTNAELLGAAEGCDPLELPEEVRLKISTNSVRRARWNANLGFYYGPSIRVRELKNILPNGGPIPTLTAVIARIYPFLYVEKKPDGCSELYNEKVRTKRMLEWEKRRQSYLEHTISQVTSEVQKENGVNTLSDGDEIRSELDQIDFQSRRYEEQEKIRYIIEERVKQKLPDELKHQNSIRQLLKVRLTNINDEIAESSAVLTIWNPSEDLMSLLSENKVYEFYNLIASGCRHGELQLSNSRMTRYVKTPLLPMVVRYQRRFTPVGYLKSDFVSPFGEIDTVGVVICNENIDVESNGANEIVYLADLNQNILAVTFKSNSKGNGFEEILKPKHIIAGVDLQWKGGSLHWKIPVVFASDYSYFAHKPRHKYLHVHLDDFETYFKHKSIDEFVELCKKKIRDTAMARDGPAATSTPMKISSRNVTNANSSVSVSNVSLQSNESWNTSCGASSKSALSRMEQLRRYGEPPPLSPICLNARPKRAKLLVQTRVYKTNADRV